MHRYLAVFLALLAFAFCAHGQVAKRLEAMKGKSVPNFTLRDLDGRTHSFAQFHGKVVLLNFWSPY